MAREAGPATEALQGAITAHGLQQSYSIQFEFARALREATKDLLRSHIVPRLAAAADRLLWLHFVEEMVVFER